MTHNPTTIIRLICISIICLCSLAIISPRADAAEYEYKISVSPLLQRYIVKPTFGSIETEFVISNEGDPAYVHISTPTMNEVTVTVAQISPFVENSGYGKTLSFLMLSKETRQFRMNLRRNNQELGLKDYIVDTTIGVQAPSFTGDDRLSANIQPTIHSKTILSASPDGKIAINPKIALFRNRDGYFILNSEPVNLILTIQNRGEYMFPVSGFITVVDPAGKRTEVPIAKTYVPANNQRNLITDIKGRNDILLSIEPKYLRGGQYSVSGTLELSNSSTQNVYGHTSFFVVPREYIVAAACLLLTILGIIFYISLRHV